MTSTSDPLSFARLLPLNQRAKLAFADAVRVLQQRGEDHELRFYRDAGNQLITAKRQDIEISQDAEKPVSTSTSIPPSGLHDVFANLTLSKSARPKYPRIGWRVGHTTKSVEIRMTLAENADENTEPQDSASSNMQFRLFLHPHSGLLCVQRSATSLELSYGNKAQEYIPLAPLDTIVFVQPTTKLKLGDFEFQVEYIVSDEHAGEFFGALDAFLTKNSRGPRHPKGQFYPSTGPSLEYGKYMVGGKLGSGTFGDVYYGIDKVSGDPVALKTIRVTNAGTYRETVTEIKLLEQLRGSPYCVQVIGSWCQNHNRHPTRCPGGSQDTFFIVTNLGLFDFNDVYFTRDLPFRKMLELSRQILLGIQDLQQRGIIHRDISLRNCLVLSTEPAVAMIGDFGKAIRAVKSKQQAIGPTHTCAPEVWTGDGYTNTVDLWAWAYMMSILLGYRMTNLGGNVRITERRLSEIIVFLKGFTSDQKPKYAPLADLLIKILKWNPRERLTVDESLVHDVWKAVPGKEEDDLKQAPDAKRLKTGASNSGVT